GWSYGVYGALRKPVGPRSFMITAPVQSGSNGDAISAILANVHAFPGDAPVTPEELDRVTEGTIRSLPNQFETNGSVLSAILQNDRLGRPHDYYETLAATYRAMDATRTEAAARDYLQQGALTFV